MRIVLIHQYHHNPDCPATCRHYEMVERWSRRHEVTIISSTAWEGKRITRAYPWVPASARMIRFDVPYTNEMTPMQRVKAFASFAAKTIKAGRLMDAPDVVIGTSTPLTAVWAAQRLSRRWRAPFVFEVQDLWPDFPIEMGAVPRPLHRALRKFETSLYRSADHVVTLSPDMTAHVESRGVPPDRISTLLQGTNVDAAAAARTATRTAATTPVAPEGPKRILYAGTFGRANDIKTILAAAERLAGDPRVRFVFAGHGFHESTILDTAARLPNIELVAPAPHHSVFDLFASSFVSLVTFADIPSVAAGSPSKLFDSLAAGCPVIVNTNGWMRRLVESHECGWYVEAEEPSRLADLIVSLVESPDRVSSAGSNGVRYADDRFDRRQIADAFEAVLESVVSRERPVLPSPELSEAA